MKTDCNGRLKKGMKRRPKNFQAITTLEGTKIALDQHILSDYSKLYNMRVEGSLSGCDVALPCVPNGLVVIDIDVPDGEKRTVDGRPFWNKWLKEHGGEDTYIVNTKSGGQHYYYYLPDHIDADTFAPKKQLAPGVDVKARGYVICPPTPGYEPVEGRRLGHIKPLSNKLLKEITDKFHEPFKGVGGIDMKNLNIHTPIPMTGIPRLKGMLADFAAKNFVNYDDWIKGIFSITTAIDDIDEREICLEIWTRNKSFAEGDVEKALEISRRSDPTGEIGPGTIFKMIEEERRKVEVSDSVFPSFEEIMAGNKLQTIQKKAGVLVILPTESNVSSILEKVFPYSTYDASDPNIHKSLFLDSRKQLVNFRGKHFTDGTKTLSHIMLDIIQKHYNLPHFKQGIIKNGLEVLLTRRKVDPCAEEMKKLKWDGKERIKSFFSAFFPAQGSHEYLQAVSRHFWRSFVYRIVEPGIKCDEIIILIGPEGIRKSSIIDAVGQDYSYACGEENAFASRDVLLNMHKATIVELEEMVPLSNANPKVIKGYISRRKDTIRQMFGEGSYDSPRSFMMVGTENNTRFLTESMGIRRFLPVELGTGNKIDVELCKKHRDQLIAEALVDYNNDVPLYVDFTQYQMELVARHQYVSPNAYLHEEIANFIKHKNVADPKQIFNHLTTLYPCTSHKQAEKNYKAINRVLDTNGFIKEYGTKNYVRKIDTGFIDNL